MAEGCVVFSAWIKFKKGILVRLLVFECLQVYDVATCLLNASAIARASNKFSKRSGQCGAFDLCQLHIEQTFRLKCPSCNTPDQEHLRHSALLFLFFFALLLLVMSFVGTAL